MANEISFSATLNVTKNGVTLNNAFSATADMAGDNMLGSVQAVGTSSEAVVLGDVSTIGYLLVKNLDATNYIEIDSATTFDAFPQKLPAGGVVLLRPQTATLYVKANTASCNVYIQAVEL